MITLLSLLFTDKRIAQFYLGYFAADK